MPVGAVQGTAHKEHRETKRKNIRMSDVCRVLICKAAGLTAERSDWDAPQLTRLRGVARWSRQEATVAQPSQRQTAAERA
jgi:hypothetical protein